VLTGNPGSDRKPNLAATAQIVAEWLTHLFFTLQLTHFFKSDHDYVVKMTLNLFLFLNILITKNIVEKMV